MLPPGHLLSLTLKFRLQQLRGQMSDSQTETSQVQLFPETKYLWLLSEDSQHLGVNFRAEALRIAGEEPRTYPCGGVRVYQFSYGIGSRRFWSFVLTLKLLYRSLFNELMITGGMPFLG